MQRITFVILLSLLSLFTKAEGGYQFRYINTSRGLSNNSVFSMLVDSEGYLWIGTQSGLNRYDGYEVAAFSVVDDQFSLTNVNYMEECGDGHVWIENSNTYTIYDLRTHTLHNSADSLISSMGINARELYRIKATRHELWVMQDGLLHCFDCASGKTRTWKVPQLKMDRLYTRGTAVADDGIYLSFGNSVWFFSKETADMQRISLSSHQHDGNEIYTTFIDKDKTVWIYSIITNMVCKYKVGGRVVRDFIHLSSSDRQSDNNAIRDMLDDGHGNIWIATDHEGVFLYHKQNESIRNIRHNDSPSSISSDNVTCLVRDRQGTVWMGHYKTGISYTISSTGLFHNLGGQFGDVTALEYDTKGNLWVGTDGDGLYVQHADGSYQKTPLPNINISSIVADRDGSVWVGTYNHGLYHMNNVSDYEYFSVANGALGADNVWKMIDDGMGHLWYSSALSALFRFDKKQHRSTKILDPNKHDIVGYSLAQGNGHLFVGTVYGLWNINLKSGRQEFLLGNKSGRKFLSTMIINEHYDARRHILLLGHLEGITIYDMMNDSLYYLTHQLGGAGAAVRCIAEDAQGFVWVSTSKGLSRVNISRSATSLSIGVQNYTSHEGLQALYFNENAFAHRANTLLFGCSDGFVSFNAQQTSRMNSLCTAPIVSDIIVNGRAVPLDNQCVTVDYDEANITIKFFTGDLNNSSRVRYAYMLQGAMSDWTYTDENHISLIGLSPGNYTLLIALCGPDGSRGEVREIDIKVCGPFYLSWWMMMVYLLIVCALAYYAFYRYNQRQKEKLMHEKEEAERQKNAQLMDMKMKFFTNISHDLRTPLTLIISPLDSIINKVEGGEQPSAFLPSMKNIQKNARLLYNQVTSLLDFRRLDVGVETLQPSVSDIVAQLSSICLSFHDYALEKEIDLQFKSEKSSFLMSYDKKKVEKIVYNLLSNAFKFTPNDGHIMLTFAVADNKAVIEVADSGQGISDDDKKRIFQRFYQSKSNDSTQTGSGIGLHIANEYVMLHDGSLSVRDNEKQGSIFRVELPIKETDTTPLASKETHTDESPSATSGNAASQPTILVVDDNPDMLAFVSESLKEHYAVLTATNGQEALEVMGRQSVSLVVSDVMMPVMDGLELCRRIKSDINLSHVPVILLTALTTEANQVEGLQLGADDYIMKPFNMEVLALRVSKFMEWAEKSHRQFREKMDIEPSEITITPLDEQFIQNAIRIVEEHISDSEFTVETLGQAVGMSRSNLYKKLMAVTGQGPAEFIRTLRIKRGKALLEKSQMQVTEIAYAVGFNSLKSFTTNFKAEYGVTPTDYLKSLK